MAKVDPPTHKTHPNGKFSSSLPSPDCYITHANRSAKGSKVIGVIESPSPLPIKALWPVGWVTMALSLTCAVIGRCNNTTNGIDRRRDSLIAYSAVRLIAPGADPRRLMTASIHRSGSFNWPRRFDWATPGATSNQINVDRIEVKSSDVNPNPRLFFFKKKIWTSKLDNGDTPFYWCVSWHSCPTVDHINASH